MYNDMYHNEPTFPPHQPGFDEAEDERIFGGAAIPFLTGAAAGAVFDDFFFGPRPFYGYPGYGPGFGGYGYGPRPRPGYGYGYGHRPRPRPGYGYYNPW
ncbi:hypothetical protein [Salinibacillus xinjiangensis]|uniref:Uncharacterized protein n=1 Tax=Salinibacillus xinjiangensis TaxID=1229268 RepID=A0A6G1X854_9BACI|nr:hypothetical protein [Salinibacillus xinjiangensis]MRG87122.1 hypothetical protein [Salinibacillus xinjiangensis]